MADNMMRIAGRGDDGTAKAIKTNNEGNLGVQISKTITDTKFAKRQGDLLASASEIVADVNKEVEILSLVIMINTNTSSARADFRFYNKDGTLVAYEGFRSTVETYADRLYPDSLMYDDLFSVEYDDVNSIYIMRLTRPIRVNGFRLQARNNLATTVKMGIKVLWTEV